MAAITIRHLDDETKYRLQLRAARHGRSMEAEAREILAGAVAGPGEPTTLVDALRQRSAELGGFELDLPARTEQPRRPAL